MLRSPIPWQPCCSVGFCCGSSGGNASLSRSDGLSLRRMRAGELRAARFLDWLEFHEFDACLIRIEQVKLPLSIPAQLGFFVAVRRPAVSFENGLFFHDTANTE